ncbi:MULTISPECIES: NAD(+)/NADH kinase [unclassified Sedimentibacter]|uniref:NAD(+)/NADH kinase n=1 Tax=unclassified Sedimentibacter TaxID=2649220 RepID=UPI0027E13B79|nr:NAD(+)/NADH kinase [Sedimentibacter sp. MB35-C1]WMJ78657.1 NAD(+)/NADH kinase [Sedimentibacter sp. MB35-C1]
MNQKVICISSSHDDYTLKIKEKLIEIFEKHGYQHHDGFRNNCALNITIGGDGTFLRGVRESNFSRIPFVGINTGTLGFYPEIIPENLESFVSDFVSGNYAINNINLIECEICSSEKSQKIYAVNDIILKRKDMKTMHMDVYIASNHLEKISGDGLIISSPLGSSAYNKSAGGCLVYPSLKTLQITPLSPIISNAYRCLDCSIIVPPEFEITIYPERKEDYYVALLADGETIEYDVLECVHFRTSKKIIKKLSTGTFNYWHVIKDKFL